MNAELVSTVSEEKEESVRQAVASLALEGLTMSPETLDDMRSGLSENECVARSIARHGCL